jgi:hypothetical protein
MVAAVTLLSAGTAPPAHAEDTTVDAHYTIPYPSNPVPVVVNCPSDWMSWALDTRDYTPGVGSKGISVTQDGGGGVTVTGSPKLWVGAPSHPKPYVGFTGTATNRTGAWVGVTLTAHCTNDPTQKFVAS